MKLVLNIFRQRVVSVGGLKNLVYSQGSVSKSGVALSQ